SFDQTISGGREETGHAGGSNQRADTAGTVASLDSPGAGRHSLPFSPLNSPPSMTRIHTKEAAEAILRELPSVVGAFVREDVNGHPREVHLLISPGPDPASLARDVRALLEERLGVTVDQRVISIAQLADPPAPRAAPEFD